MYKLKATFEDMSNPTGKFYFQKDNTWSWNPETAKKFFFKKSAKKVANRNGKGHYTIEEV